LTLRAALRRLPHDTPEIRDAEYNLMVMPAAWRRLYDGKADRASLPEGLGRA
jgi:hypothetical protein